ncbi:MAG: hypothetical protein K2W96_07640 [Gemmataceae bacterium]|nr:hypothetical protein [Gemmataceae bacterium]
MTDPLEELLGPKGPPASEEVRRRVLDRTLKALRRRPPYVPLGLLMAGLAAGLMLLAGPSPRASEPETLPPVAGKPDAVALEWKALDGDRSQYVAAGDAYAEEGAPAQAVRCYGHALEKAEDLEWKEGDSFLLMAIKNARKKEMEECGR